jgi:hypothetical protein
LGLTLLSYSLLTGVAIGQVNKPVSNEAGALCRVDALPAAIQRHLQQEYSSWRVQEVSDVSAQARGRWESDKPLSCPGIASGHFESASTRSYALLLVAKANTEEGYKFVVFSESADRSDYKFTILDTANAGRANFFVTAAPIKKFFDEPSKKRFKAFSPDGILEFDSAEKEYGVAIYYFSEGRYRNDPIDY